MGYAKSTRRLGRTRNVSVRDTQFSRYRTGKKYPHDRSVALALLFVFLVTFSVLAEPIIFTGKDVPALLGTRIQDLRIFDSQGKVIPFQIDEMTRDGEYVCDRGENPNPSDGTGVLDSLDEIVFLWEDAAASGSAETTLPTHGVRLSVTKGAQTRSVVLASAPQMPLSPVRYIQYDHTRQLVETPHYFAQFGKNRFHFVRAGVVNRGKRYLNLTRELRVIIYVRVLWGLLPISYDEESLYCFVKRYKVGPLRLIRRGDFHLRLGLGIKGSRASVNQICYPQNVGVPVTIHLPISFRKLSREAWIEMAPVIDATGKDFAFHVPGNVLPMTSTSSSKIDTLVSVLPNRKYFSVHDGTSGFGWLLRAGMPDSVLGGSGYIFRRPSDRGGVAHGGFRLTVLDLAKGQYFISNDVFFSDQGASGLESMYKDLIAPATISVGTRRIPNRFPAPPLLKRSN